jgi:hypothetical protein
MSLVPLTGREAKEKDRAGVRAMGQDTRESLR